MELKTIIKKSKELVKLYKGFITSLEVIKIESVSFDGKVINKRYFDFINERLIESGYKLRPCEYSYAHFRLSYVVDLFKSFPNLTYRDNYYDFIKSNGFVIANKRLNYTNLVCMIDEEINKLNSMINELNDNIENAGTYQNKMLQAVKAFNEVCESVPLEFRGGLSSLRYRDW